MKRERERERESLNRDSLSCYPTFCRMCLSGSPLMQVDPQQGKITKGSLTKGLGVVRPTRRTHSVVEEEYAFIREVGYSLLGQSLLTTDYPLPIHKVHFLLS